MLASAQPETELVRQLLLGEATVWARDRDGNTAIHYAARSGPPETVRLLLTAGADPNATNSAGGQPIELAEENPQAEEVTRILLTAGATPPPEDRPDDSDDERSDERTDDRDDAGDDDRVSRRDDDNDARDEQRDDGSDDGRADRSDDDRDRDDEADRDDEREDDDADDRDGRLADRPDPPQTKNVLYPGERPPRNADGTTLVISGYVNRIPASWDRRLHSKENPQSVTLTIDNWYDERIEVFQIRENGRPRGIGRPEPYTSLQLPTQQGNVFVFYGADGAYFGHYSTTGVREQRVRLDVRE
jgi:hypothetical protein